MAQIKDLQNKLNSLSDARESVILNPGHVRDQPDCRETHRIARVVWETFLDDLLKKDNPLQSQTIQRIWHLLLTS